VPARRWGAILAAAAVTTALMAGGWEMWWRSRGYQPSLEDDPDLWAAARSRVDSARRDQIILVGDSRTLFDMDLVELQRGLGGPLPIQLATVGTNPLFMLEQLAGEDAVRGTVIVGVTPGLYFLPAGMAEELPRKGLKRYQAWSLAQKASFRLFMLLDRRLAFLNSEMLSLRKLNEHVDLPQRDGVDASWVPFIHTIDRDRRAKLRSAIETDAAFRDQVRAIWMAFIPPPPPDPRLAEAEREGERQRTLWRSFAAVERIRARGGRVIYVLMPSSGALRDVEEKGFPRRRWWNALLAATGAPGIDYREHRELARFDCPEWSHLSAADSVEFTRRLVPLLKPHLGPR